MNELDGKFWVERNLQVQEEVGGKGTFLGLQW